jgi:hypothetical protein
VLVAIVGLVSAVVGGVVQAIFARRFERFRFEREAKWDLYSKYFVALAELSFADKGTERYQNAMSLTAQLRGRIGLVGSPEVVEAVAKVFQHPGFQDPEGQTALADALAAMRKDIGNERAGIAAPELLQLMFASRK